MLGRVIRDLFGKPSNTSTPDSMTLAAGDNPIYAPEVFAVPDMERAKSIILTPEGGLTTHQRWVTETEYLAGAIGNALQLDRDALVLDYGCGVGRMSKALIEQYGCMVIGVDISSSMRQLAPGYVSNDLFSVVSPEVLEKLVANGLQIDFGIAIWVLQHCPRVSDDIARIKSSLKENAQLFVLNNNVPAIPTNKGWVNDGTNIRELLEQEFTVLRYSRLPTDATTSVVSENTFVAHIRNDKRSS